MVQHGECANDGQRRQEPQNPEASPAPTWRRFSDDFERPGGATVGNGWTPLRGDWAIVDGSLRGSGGRELSVIAQTALQLGREFTIEAQLTLDAPGSASLSGGVAFNIQNDSDGTENLYVVLLRVGAQPTWQLRQVASSVLTREPAWRSAELVAHRPYTVRVAASHPGRFDVWILAGPTVVGYQAVDLDPLDRQLTGGYAGVCCAGASKGATLAVTNVTATTSVEPSKPPAPPRPNPLCCVPVEGPTYELPVTRWSVVDASRVDETQSLIGVGQTLLTHGSLQYAVYYNAKREMTVAQRSLGENVWVHQTLGEDIGWDAHNAVTMAVDRVGNVHVAGDMHNNPLIYFRTSTPGDITTLEKVASMVDPSSEQSETYPGFLDDGSGDLIYSYRDGVSGNGVIHFNRYDAATKAWNRLLDEPLFDGENRRNAYPNGPRLGPDGRFHVVWVWRDTGDAATNGHLCYARSKDLRNWETIDGTALPLPIVYSTPDVIVDPVPIYGGLINGIPTIGFDADNQVLISYWKFDAGWNTQVYVARPSGGNNWEVIQVSRWRGRFHPLGVAGAGPGMGRPPLVSPVSPLPDGHLQLSYSYGPAQGSEGTQSGTWILDPKTLQPFTEAPLGQVLTFGGGPGKPILPDSLTSVRSPFPGMAVNLTHDRGSAPSSSEMYVMRWEALPNNNDQPQPHPWPSPSPLEVYLLRSS